MKMENSLVLILNRILGKGIFVPFGSSNGIKSVKIPLELKTVPRWRTKLFSHESVPFKCTFPFVRRARESVRLRCKCRASNGRPRPAFPDTPIMPRCELTRQGEWAMARHKGKVPTGQAAYRSIPRSFDLSSRLPPSLSRTPWTTESVHSTAHNAKWTEYAS